MSFNVLNRKIHYRIAFGAAAPMLVMICSGLLLQAKKHWTWVQRPSSAARARRPSSTSKAFSRPCAWPKG